MPTSPLTVCHLADVHLGYRRYTRVSKNGFNQREVDVSAAFREAIDRVIERRPHIIVIAGDLFHSVRPSNATLTFCFRELKRLTAVTKAPVVIVAGNHETPKRADSGCALRILSEIPGVYVADSSPERLFFGDIETAVYAVPHAAYFAERMERFRADDRAVHNILCTHAQVGTEWMSEFGGATIDLSLLAPSEWDYIALGHVHVAQQVAPNAWYSGALEHTANNIWAEGSSNKGFLEVSLPSQKVTFHALTAPREIYVCPRVNAAGSEPDAIAADMRERLESIPGGIDGKLVRLEVVDIPREVLRLLDEKQFKRFRNAALHLSLEFRAPIVHEATTRFSPNRRRTLTDLVSEYVSVTATESSAARFPPAERAALLELLRGYIRKVEEGDEASPS